MRIKALRKKPYPKKNQGKRPFLSTQFLNLLGGTKVNKPYINQLKGRKTPNTSENS
jgi:hypothetical protein